MIAGPNPWGAPTLEWATTSPPPRYNFGRSPTVRGRYALWEKDFDRAPVVVGLSTEKHEVLTTSLLDAQPEHRYELTGDSILPLLLAIGGSGCIIGAIFDPWFVVLGSVLSALILGVWFWVGPEQPKHVKKKHKDKHMVGESLGTTAPLTRGAAAGTVLSPGEQRP